MNTYKIYLRLDGKLTNTTEFGATSLEALSKVYKSIPKAEFVEIKLVVNGKPLWALPASAPCRVCCAGACNVLDREAIVDFQRNGRG